VLKKLLNGEIKTRSRRNLIQSRSFAEMLEKTIIWYQNRSIETIRVIEELIELKIDLILSKVFHKKLK
jgi:type I restriction enzyme R subunit